LSMERLRILPMAAQCESCARADHGSGDSDGADRSEERHRATVERRAP
jgi:hypothetical protein